MGSARSVVYFAYLGEEGSDGATVAARFAFMERQLRWLAPLVADAPVTVAYVAPRSWDAAVARAVDVHGFRLDPLSVAGERRNTFEYPGFRAMQAIARRSALGDLLYYCHSKGIVGCDEGKMGLFRLHTALGLATDLADFTVDPALTRATIFPARFGWCWYNFFWVKAGYMAARTVAEHHDRYEFEALIGNRGDREGYRAVLPLIGRLPVAVTGIAPQPWYRAEETSSAALAATYARYAAMASPAEAAADLPVMGAGLPLPK